MRIAILTFHNADNYGSVLQACATRNYVNMICPNAERVEIVNYIPPNQAELYSIFLPNNSVKNIIKNVRAFFFYKILKERKKTFEEFRKTNLGVSGSLITNLDDLNKYLNDFDYLITGSDQIWNPRSQDFSMAYFGPAFKGTKIAYAPSFGNAIVEDFKKNQIEDELRNYLADYSSISVRERSGLDILKHLSATNGELVVDPTLLCEKEKWESMVTANKDVEPYIFFYSIDYNQQAVEFVQAISQRTGLKVKIIFSTNKTYGALGKGFELVKETSPLHFLQLIKEARIVLSTSFHGVAFSVIFRKDFWALETERKRSIYRDERIHTLLENLGIENRIVRKDEIENHDFLGEKLLYDESRFAELVEESKDFLKKGLQVEC